MSTPSEFSKDDRPGAIRILASGATLKIPFRSLKLPSNAAAAVVVTIVSGGEQLALPLAEGEQVPVAGSEIVSVVPPSDVIYWIL